jgi:hypothetical protein
MIGRLAVPAALACLAAALAVPVSAQNLLVNPHFDASLSGWQTGGDVSWDGTRDANASHSSGSAKTVWRGYNPGEYPLLAQCVPVTPGTVYLFVGKIFIPLDQTTSGSASLVVIPFGTSDCSGPLPPGAPRETPPVFNPGSWTVTSATIAPFGASVLLAASVAPNVGGPFQVNFDDLILEPIPPGTCIDDAHDLCLLNGRFRLTASFDAGNGNSGQARTESEGLLWFFSPSNTEAVVKMLDGCGVNHHYWFFAGGLTNVEVTITLTDTRTGVARTYHNPLGTPFAPIQDTAAFDCPP